MNTETRIAIGVVGGLSVAALTVSLPKLLKGKFDPGEADSDLLNTGKSSDGITLPKTGNNSFPLRVGSQGASVERFQQYLLQQGGLPAQHIRDSGGADGSFGSGTARAASAAGVPVVVTEVWFNDNVLKSTSAPTGSGISPSVLAEQLAGHVFTAWHTTNSEILSVLSNVKTNAEYTQVDAQFKKNWRNVFGTSLAFALIPWRTGFYGAQVTNRLKQLGAL